MPDLPDWLKSPERLARETLGIGADGKVSGDELSKAITPASAESRGLDLGGKVDVKANGLCIRQALTWDEYTGLMGTLQDIHGAYQWWLGDALRYGESRWGDTYTQAVTDTGIDAGRLMNYVYVANAYPEISLRNEKVSWSHHYTLASLPPADRAYWLAQCETKGLTVSQLKAATGKTAASEQSSTFKARYGSLADAIADWSSRAAEYDGPVEISIRRVK